MNILIVGGESMVGRSLRKRLEVHHSVCSTGLSEVADVFFDITSDTPPIIEGSFDVIVHCAANFGGKSLAAMLNNEQTNAVGAIRVCQLAERVGCQHIIYLSTIFSYDVLENEYFGSYGLSKQHGQENIELFCRQAGLTFTALLPSQIYDEYEEARKHQPFFYFILDRAAAGLPVCFYGTKDPLRNFLYVEDLTRIVDMVIDKGIKGVYPCVHPRSYRVSEIAEIAFAVYGGISKIEFLPQKPDISTVYLPREESLYRTLGYFPETDLRDGIEKIRLQQGGKG